MCLNIFGVKIKLIKIEGLFIKYLQYHTILKSINNLGIFFFHDNNNIFFCIFTFYLQMQKIKLKT